MTRTQNLRNQHDEILEVAGNIAALLDPTGLSKDGKTARQLLVALSGKIKVHLAMEDRSLYPTLLDHSDDKVRSLTKSYVDEMGSIAQTFTEYLKNWPTGEAIQENPTAFIQETKALFKVLSTRIRKENDELYKLVDDLEQRPAA